MNTQPEALRLALMLEMLAKDSSMGHVIDVRRDFCRDAAAELRRIHAHMQALEEAQSNADAMRQALERIADERNTNFAGDAQVVARDVLNVIKHF